MDDRLWSHLADELENLLPLDSDGREARLTALRSSAPRLARHLEEALAADRASIPLLDQPLKFDFHDYSLEHDESDELQPGTMVGPWKLVSELGKGGMGRVWLASRDDDHYQIDVALKLIDFARRGDLVSAQIRLERQILADLDHPQIARLVDGGVRDNGTPWYAMEYVRGLPLDQYCSRNDLSLAERLRLIERTARVVHHAHANLVVHRDLKPSNILVDEDGNPHLLDFGIAKLLDESQPSRPGTMTLLAASTPAYAAPEQLRGESVGIGADIYSLGVLAYEILCGKRPPRADCEAMARDGAVAPLPSEAIQGDRRLRVRVRGDVDSIVSQAMAPAVESRYASAATLADDIDRHLTGMPVAARRAGTVYRARKFVDRHWLGVGSTVALVVVLTVALAVSTVLTRRTEDALARATAIQGFLLEVFDASQPGPADIGIVLQRDLVERAAQRLDQLLLLSPEDRLELSVSLGRVFRKLGLADRAEELIRQAVESSGKPAGGRFDSRLVEALYELGRANYYTGDFDSGIRHLTRADQLAIGMGPKYDGPHRAAILHELGSLKSGARDTQGAMETLAEALILAKSSPGALELVPRILVMQAITLGRANQLDTALVVGMNAVDSARSLLGPQHERLASTLSAVGGMHRRAGKLEPAEQMLRQALRIETEAYGQARSATVNNLANVLLDKGHLDEAGRLYAKGLELAAVRMGAGSAGAASYRRNLALYQATVGSVDDAVENLEKAYRIYGSEHAIDTGINLNMRSQLAWVLWQAGESDRAFELLTEIFVRAESMEGVARAALCRAHMIAGKAAFKTGRFELARSHIESALAEVDAYPLGNSDQVSLYMFAGDAHAALADHEAARENWDRARELARERLGGGHPLVRLIAAR